jgi:Big-like domain-containing protein
MKVSKIAIALVVANATLGAQTAPRRATTAAALVAYPGFFQGQAVVVRGTLATRDQAVLISTGADKAIPLIFRGTSPADGPVELRATFWDVGRLQREDPRLQQLGLNRLLPSGEGEWPRPGEVNALVVTDAATVKPDPAPPTLRMLALAPENYVGQRVTINGQFRGRNLYGDLPQSPGATQWDFVLHSGDASLWVTGQRPRGKGFNLDVDARVDTGHWLQVAGTVRQGRGLMWIEATQVAMGKPDLEFHVEAPPPPIVGPAPEVIFSDPEDGEADVSLKKTVRLQFSRDINPDSLKGNVHWHYAASDSREELPQAKLAVRYERATRSVEIKIDADDLARYKNVAVELTDGIAATDGARLKPWTITFTLGGQ